jgi:hypothetical protein
MLRARVAGDTLFRALEPKDPSAAGASPPPLGMTVGCGAAVDSGWQWGSG